MKMGIIKYVFFYVLLFIGLDACNQQHDSKAKKKFWIDTISCDFEKYNQKNGQVAYKTDSTSYTIKTKYPAKPGEGREGSVAMVVDTFHATLLTIDKLAKGQLVEISIWQKNTDSTAYIEGVTRDNRVLKSNPQRLGKVKKGWRQHFISIPIIQHDEEVKLTINTQGKEVYFDDLAIKIYPVLPKNEITKKLQIYIPDNSKKKLNNYIDKALGMKVIPASSKKYVKAYLINKEDTVGMKMKLKGDWTDHIQPDKASYRIKMSKNGAYRNMTTFSIQHPKTRNFFNEYIVHRIAEDQDVLTTTYDFIDVMINDYHYGVYALEEHFDKHILENRRRREGPILKYDESGVWAMQVENHNNNKNIQAPFFASSVTTVFKKKRTLKSLTLNNEFDEGKKLLQLFKTGNLAVEGLFDVDQLAKYYAIVELSGNYHTLAWHNRRFYYNPVTEQLENILYDVAPTPTSGRNIMKEILTNVHKEKNLVLDNAIVLNKDFKKKYFYYLQKYTESAYLDTLFGRMSETINRVYPAIQGESPEYKFSKQEFFSRAKEIRGSLKELERIWTEKLNQAKGIDYWMEGEKYAPYSDDTFLAEISINAYVSPLDGGGYKLTIENYHLNKVSINSYVGGGSKSTIPLANPIELVGYIDTAEQKTILLDSIPSKIIFTVENVPNKTFSKSTIPWGYPKGKSSRMRLQDKFQTSSEYYSIEGDQLTFKKKTRIDELIYVPRRYKVQVLPGSEIEFYNGGGLIINNDFLCLGTEQAPITIICKDNTSKGITVLDGGQVIIHHTTLEGLSSLNHEKWMLTGALTIYQTPTEISNLTIEKNNSEDALNIIRSHFDITNLQISNTLSDGFDADFCSGIIRDSRFRNTGNDCIDFSGSKISIENIDILHSGDKGISGGEKSDLTLKNIQIDDSVTGIASKDSSIINGTAVMIKNTKTGLTAFQKKATYGAASINLQDCVFEKTQEEVMVEKNSTITVDGKKYEGKVKFDIEKIYSVFK